MRLLIAFPSDLKATAYFQTQFLLSKLFTFLWGPVAPLKSLRGRFLSYSLQKMGFSSLISPQSLSPSHRKARGTQIFVVWHFVCVDEQVRGALKRQPDRHLEQTYQPYHKQCRCYQTPTGKGSNPRKACSKWAERHSSGERWKQSPK